MGLFDTGSGLIKDTDFLDIWGKNAGEGAINAQRDAASKSAAMQEAMFRQQREDLTPWREAGSKALGQMQGDDYMKDFTMADFQADPGYAFRVAEGQKALERSASAKGGLMSGATMKGLTQYGQEMGSQEYGNAYGRFNADRDRRFGRLSTLSSGGLQAAGGMAGAAQHYGDVMNDNYIGMANAEGAAKIGASNQSAGMFGQGMSMLAMGSSKKSSGSSSSAAGPTNTGTFYNGAGNGGYSVGGASGMYDGVAFCDERLKTDVRDASIADLAAYERDLSNRISNGSEIDIKRAVMLMLAKAAA
jgi:hypothetical protein